MLVEPSLGLQHHFQLVIGERLLTQTHTPNLVLLYNLDALHFLCGALVEAVVIGVLAPNAIAAWMASSYIRTYTRNALGREIGLGR